MGPVKLLNNNNMTFIMCYLPLFTTQHNCISLITIGTSDGTSKTVRKVLRDHFSDLRHATENCLQDIAAKLYSEELISREVRKSPTFDKIENEFVAIITLYKEDMTKLEKFCFMFIHCLASAGGSAKAAAKVLAEDWKCNLNWSFKIETSTEIALVPEIIIGPKDKIPLKIQDLHEKFASLLLEIRIYYDECNLHKLKNVARWVSQYLGVGLSNSESFDKLFDSILCHYDFLNVKPIEDLAKKFPLNGKLQLELEQYVKELQEFEGSTELKDMRTAIEQVTLPKSTLPDSDASAKIEIKLTGTWENISFKSLQKLMEHLFREDFKRFKLVTIGGGSVTVIFLFPISLAQKLIIRAELKCPYMHHLGIFELIINNHPVIDGRDEYANFSFEESLLNTIAALHTTRDQEFEKMALFLTELEINIKYKNEKGNTALLLVSEIGHYHLTEILLKKDPGINIQDNFGWTSLMTASKEGHHQVVELLLNKNPDIDIQNNNGWTALMFACRHGHQKVVELLLNSNPNINIEDRGWTALMHACRQGHDKVVEILLRKNPNMNIQDKVHGLTALMLASIKGHHKVIELLLDKNPDVSICDTKGMNALMIACQQGHHKVVKLLLAKNLDINAQNDDSCTALMIASKLGHHEVVEVLHSKDLDVNIKDRNGMTALMLACDKEHHQVIKLLLKTNSDINAKERNGQTALMRACCNSHYQVVELLLSKDHDVNVQDNNGITALMFASASGHKKIVQLLLIKDPNINIQGYDGMTALMVASSLGHHHVVKLLLSKELDINIKNVSGWTALICASCYGHYQVVEALLSSNPEINIQSEDGWSALMHACQEGHHQIVELLLKKDPDMNIKNKYGVTALMLACDNGYDKVTALLLTKDKNIDIQDNEGWTALMHACRRGYHQVVQVLLRKSPNLNICNIHGLDALTSVLFYFKFLAKGYETTNSNLQLVNPFKTLELLLSCHPNHIHTIDNVNLHSLAVAAVANNLEAVKILMKNCNISMEFIISAFSMACYQGHLPMIIHLSHEITLSNDERKLLVAAAEGDIGTLVSMLFEVGMSPDTPLVGGITPLMIAASCGHIDIVDTLIQAGADVNATDDEGNTALEITKNIKVYDRKNIVAVLVANTPADKPDSTIAVKKRKRTTFAMKHLLSVLDKAKSFLLKAYNPVEMKNRALVQPHERKFSEQMVSMIVQ